MTTDLTIFRMAAVNMQKAIQELEAGNKLQSATHIEYCEALLEEINMPMAHFMSLIEQAEKVRKAVSY